MKKIFLIMLIISSCLTAGDVDHVILVIIDGARYTETISDSTCHCIPRIRELYRYGTVIDTFMNDGATYTSRAIPAIWSGSWSSPEDTLYHGFSTKYATAPTVWEYLRKERDLDSTDAMYFILDLPTPWLQSFHKDYGPEYWPWYILHGSSDVDVWENARDMLEQYHPVFTTIYLADVDHYGHGGNWDEYTNAISVADSIVGCLWDFVQSDPVFADKTTIMVTNDHGRHSEGVSSGFRGHGCGCWGCRRIMFLAVGAGVKQGYISPVKRNIPDITPTIGSLLNFHTPYADGESMTEILIETGVGVKSKLLVNYQLHQNYPNPFNPSTSIAYELPENTHVNISVYDVNGHLLDVLVNENKNSGRYTVKWIPENLVTGVYFFKIKTKSFYDIKKCILLK